MNCFRRHKSRIFDSIHCTGRQPLILETIHCYERWTTVTGRQVLYGAVTIFENKHGYLKRQVWPLYESFEHRYLLVTVRDVQTLYLWLVTDEFFQLCNFLSICTIHIIKFSYYHISYNICLPKWCHNARMSIWIMNCICPSENLSYGRLG